MCLSRFVNSTLLRSQMINLSSRTKITQQDSVPVFGNHYILKSIGDEMGKDADKFLSKKGWIRDRSVDGGLIYCYNENKMKEALQ